MVEEKDGLTAVLKSTVIFDKGSEPNNNANTNSNKRNRSTKDNKAEDKRAKLVVPKSFRIHLQNLFVIFEYSSAGWCAGESESFAISR